MTKVIRVCEITGRVNTIATNLTDQQASNLIQQLSANDDFGSYYKVQ